MPKQTLKNALNSQIKIQDQNKKSDAESQLGLPKVPVNFPLLQLVVNLHCTWRCWMEWCLQSA